MGFNEVVELREQLVHANVTFATEIADIQESFNESIKGLTDKVFYMVNKNQQSSPNDYGNIILTPPVVLMLQLLETTMSSVSNILASFQNLEIPTDPYYLLEQYIPYVDWNEFREQAKKYNIKQQTADSIGDKGDDEGMGGGFGRM